MCVAVEFILSCAQAMMSSSAMRREAFKKEIGLAKGILDLKEAVLMEGEPGKRKIKEIQDRFKEQGPAGSVSSGSQGDGGGAHTLRSAPPTGSVSRVVGISELMDLIWTVQQRCGSQDDFKKFKEEFSKKLGPWRDIVKTMKSRATHISNRRKVVDKAKQDEDKKNHGLPKVLVMGQLIVVCHVKCGLIWCGVEFRIAGSGAQFGG